jgi:[acyl-carrier-protein] S-malonyltransferase
VRWEQVVRRLIDEGATTFVELGPGKVLSGLIKQIDRGVTVVNVEDEGTLETALRAIEKPA